MAKVNDGTAQYAANKMNVIAYDMYHQELCSIVQIIVACSAGVASTTMGNVDI